MVLQHSSDFAVFTIVHVFVVSKQKKTPEVSSEVSFGWLVGLEPTTFRTTI